MALNLVPPYDKITALLTALPGMQKVFEGVPQTLEKGVNAYVAVTAQEVTDEYSSGLIRNKATFFVGLSYVVRANDASASERALLALLVELIKALVIARRTKLDDTCDTLEWDFSLASDPAYAVSGTREFRIFPVLVNVVQTEPLAFA
jgi:hypothetical protein